MAASLLCGAMFGDNLSFISDTTIAATQSLGCQMKDKFRTNIMIAFPAAVIAAVIFIFLGENSSSAVLESETSGSPSIWLIVPYLLVIVLSVLGVNVFWCCLWEFFSAESSASRLEAFLGWIFPRKSMKVFRI